ncbi:ADP-ribosylhydrolase ARH3-like [Littorina saxatilis]|uniref:ADP-ribosylhydrolase ARH3 n=1 Tax=Littorina saxatilis TaxID=31220 RepID=A0AAN9GID0_9CAEN
MLLSRVQGSLVAAVAGDCIGCLFECSGNVSMEEVLDAVQKIEQKAAKDKDETEGDRHELPFTDDTAMARSIAASLIEYKDINVPDIAARFAKEFEQEPARGYGAGVVTVLYALADPDLKDVFQPARKQFNGSGSYGNGGGMRIAPLGLFCHNQSLEELKEKTLSITRLTHTHPYAEVGALLESFAVQLALSLDNSKPLDTNNFLDVLLQRLQPTEEEIYEKHTERNRKEKDGGDKPEDKGIAGLPYCDKLELIRDLLKRDVDTDEVEEKLGTDVAALESIPTAVYCFLKGAGRSIPEIEERGPVEQTIIYAISLGGDTDTIATMAAAISGAFYGLESVPQAWQESCEGVRDALLFGEKFTEIISAREVKS